MGEGADDRAGVIATLASPAVDPEEVPVKRLGQVEGAPLAGQGKPDPLARAMVAELARS